MTAVSAHGIARGLAKTDASVTKHCLGDRNPGNPKEFWMKCDLCPDLTSERWVPMMGAMSQRTMKAVGWIKRCEPCSYRERGERKTRDDDVRMLCGSVAHLGTRRNSGKEILVTCGICGLQYDKRLDPKDADGKGVRRLGLCERCKPWAVLALKPEHYGDPTPERDAIYTKIKRLRKALENVTTKTPSGPTMPFWALAKRWDAQHPQAKPGTRAHQFYNHRLMILYFDETPIGEITLAAALEFRDSLLRGRSRLGATRSQVGVNGTMEQLKRVFRYAKEERWIKESPLPKRASFTSHRPPLADRHLVTLEEEERFLAACTGKFAHLREVLIYLADTGSYDQDRQRLKWADVDLEKRLVKGRHGSSAAMTPRLCEAMRSFCERSDHAPESPVWEGLGTGTKNDFSKLRTAAGIQGLQLSDFRRTAVWRMSQAGKSIEQIAATLGVHDLNYVRQYLQVNPETSHQEADSPAFREFIREQFVSVRERENGNGEKKRPGRKPRITEEKVRAAYQVRGAYASQEEIAEEVGVSVGSFRDWHKRQDLNYRQCLQRYSSTEGN